jgi:putative transposase
VQELIKEKQTGKSRACRVMATSRSSFRYRSVKDDGPLETELRRLAEEHPREGFWKSYFRIRNAGGTVNHKRLHRVYKAIGLSIRRKAKKRLPERVKEPIVIPTRFTHSWSIDFMSDALDNGRKFRTFNVIDDFNREILFVETDYSLKSQRVIWVLNHLVKRYGKPVKIRMDNGPEFIATITKDWSQMQEIIFQYIQPGKPTQNALIERFNKSLREGVLDAYLFSSLGQAREIIQAWTEDYNQSRPHDALGGKSPVEYRRLMAVPVLGLTPLHSGGPKPTFFAHASTPKQSEYVSI